MSKMINKLTPTSMRGQYDHQYNVFCRKNHDYGNSFEKSLDTFGLVAGIVRMNDKFERLVSLNDPSKGAQIASESLVDTLEDLSNYAAMAACWLKGKKVEDWKELRMKELDGNIEDIIKKADAIVDNMKGESKDNLHINSTGGTSSVDIKTGKIEFHPNFTKAFFKGPKEKNDDLKWDHTGAKILAKGKPKSIDIESGEITYMKPEFSGIQLFGPEKLELNLKEEIDQDKLFEISNALHPSNLPKSVKVNYGHKAVYEFPDGIDTIASYLKELSKEEVKKENDRVMLDMMLSRIEKGEVVRIVANGDGSFTTYFEKQTLNDLRRSKGFDPVEDKDDE